MKKRKNEFELKYIEDNEILLEEDRHKLIPFAWFFFKYGRIITMIFASISILTFVFGISLTLSSLPNVTPPVITNPGVIMEFNGTDKNMNAPSNAITKDYAEMLFESKVNGTETKDKFIHVVDTIIVGNDKILIFENGSAVIIYGDKDKLPVYIENKDNVKVEDGKIVINGDAIKVVDKNTLPDGTIIYEFENGKLLVEKDDEYRLIDKDDILYDKDGNILENNKTMDDVIDTIVVGNDKVLIFENGSAVIIYGDKDKLPVYIENKDNVKVDGGKITINGDVVNTIDKKKLPDGTIVYEFENDKLLIEKDGEYKLVDKDKVKYDEDGNIIIDDTSDMDLTDFTVTNNTENEVLKYRVVLEETDNYTNKGKQKLKPDYIYYKLSVNNKLQDSKLLNNNIWKIGSPIEGNLSIKNNTYILYEGQVEKLATDKFKLGMWIDYDTIGNDMQDKWFIGTIKVYAWME